MTRTLACAAFLVALTLMGCSDDTAASRVDEQGAPGDVTVAEDAASTTTAEAATVGETAADPSDDTWDLVWFSDSSGSGVAELWGARIEADLDVDVRVHDHSENGLSAAALLDRLEDPNSPLRGDVAGAEIIVVFGNPRGSGHTSDIETCVSTSTDRRDPPIAFSPEDFAPYRDTLTSIYDVIFELRGDNPTIVRAIDLYNPLIADHREAGIAEECTRAWEALSDTVRQAAAEHGIPTISMFDLFNGADHDEDPRETGYVGTDGQHTTDEGRAAQVEALDARGFAPVVTARGVSCGRFNRNSST